jgi:hypothetical protein
MEVDVDIGIKGFSPTFFVLISEQEMFMSDIADIKADVNAHLCLVRYPTGYCSTCIIEPIQQYCVNRLMYVMSL